MVEEVKVPNPKGRVPGHKLRDVDVLVFHDDADGDVVPVRGTEGRRREERARNWGRKATRAVLAAAWAAAAALVAATWSDTCVFLSLGGFFRNPDYRSLRPIRPGRSSALPS